MKIGIVTQPLHTNYGGILQNYALQQVLKRMNHDVWTIDYYKYTWLDWADSVWRVLIHNLLGHKKNYNISPIKRTRLEEPLRSFAKKQMNLTEPRTKRIGRSAVEKYAFDVIVVGSDQVWRPQYNDCIEDCFLSFISDMNIKRVAYAASFGTDEWEYTSEQTGNCAILAKKFDAISVREKSAVALCEKHLRVNATHVLDPTLLLQVEDYETLCKDIPKREAFVFAYILDGKDEIMDDIKAFAKSKNLPFIIKSADSTISSDDSIEMWISYFRDAAFVITDSFHGTIFSVIFNKDFYVYGNIQRGNSRFCSLLECLGLENRIVEKCGSSECRGIDWSGVNVKREQLAGFSIEWLRRALL